jgi:hypothetical protein
MTSRKHSDDLAARPWSGPKREYDLVKELVVALVVVGALVLGLSFAFGSPDDKSVTLQSWAKAVPSDFVATAAAELAGTSGTAGYGPPYNSAAEGQTIGPINLQKAAGVRIPIDAASDFVTGPLGKLAQTTEVQTALSTWASASPDQQAKWAGAYADAIAKVPDADYTKVAAGDFGPAPALSVALLNVAQQGSLDGVLGTQGHFFNTDYTDSLLFLADGTYLEDQARAQHLGGDQWGMMNETGSYPGQSWLWLYTFWYQIEPFSSSDNADSWVWGLMMLLTLGFVLVPFIPGIRSVPRWVPVHRLIWRDYYRTHPRG